MIAMRRSASGPTWTLCEDVRMETQDGATRGVEHLEIRLRRSNHECARQTRRQDKEQQGVPAHPTSLGPQSPATIGNAK